MMADMPRHILPCITLVIVRLGGFLTTRIKHLDHLA